MKKIIILGCNYDQIPYLKILKKQNYFIIGFDININCPGKKYCNKFHNVSYTEYKKVIKILEYEKIKYNTYLFSASSQNSIVTLCKIAKKYKIKYVSEKNLLISLDKNKLSKSLNKFKIETPKSSVIKNKLQLKKIIKKLKNNKNYFLKSDFSKNPKYVYKFNKNNLKLLNINWKKDNFLVQNYLLQEEFIGKNLRLNVYSNRYNIFDFSSHKKSNKYKSVIKKLNLVNKIQKYIKYYNLEKFIVKFDIIISSTSYTVLDIGLDPPFRMYKYCLKNKINFPKHYLNHILRNQITYPKSLDK